MQVFNEYGAALNATATIELRGDGFDVVVASRSGKKEGPNARNPDYELLVETLLRRAGTLGAALASAQVESDDTEHLPLEERLLTMPGRDYPVDLGTISDFRNLRVSLCRPQGAIGRRPGATGPGNRNKKIRIRFDVLQMPEANELESRLCRDAPANGLTAEEATAAFQGLEASVGGRRVWDPARLQAILDACEDSTPRTKERVSRYIERGPIGELVKELNGRKCQACEYFGKESTGFLTRAGVPYVEAHHIVPVSTGRKGVLRAENIVTVCPNHHRELHFGRTKVVDEGDSFRITVELGTAVIRKPAGILEALAARASPF